MAVGPPSRGAGAGVSNKGGHLIDRRRAEGKRGPEREEVRPPPPIPPPQRKGEGWWGALRQARAQGLQNNRSKPSERGTGTCHESHNTSWARIKASEAVEVRRPGTQPRAPAHCRSLFPQPQSGGQVPAGHPTGEPSEPGCPAQDAGGQARWRRAQSRQALVLQVGKPSPRHGPSARWGSSPLPLQGSLDGGKSPVLPPCALGSGQGCED